MTIQRLERALGVAIGDFAFCGLYTERLHRSPVLLTPVGVAYGYCTAMGRIEVPAVSMARLGELFGRSRVALRDVIRHELAHALAVLHPRIVDSRRFRSVFSGGYGDEPDTAEFDAAEHVTPYAATSPAEDFAEVVMVFTRHRGRFERYARRRGVFDKLRFVAELGRDLRRSGLCA